MTNMKNDADRRTIYGRFAAMARRHPDAVAIIEDGRRLTYSQLMRLAADIRSRIYDKERSLRNESLHDENESAGPESAGAFTPDLNGRYIGIVMTHGAEQVATMLAVLGSGAAYVPAEATLPHERIAYMMGVAKVRMIIDDDFCQPQSAETSAPAGDTKSADSSGLAADVVKAARAPKELTRDYSHPDGVAYVLYTSGTTGRPKGVIVENHSVANYADAFRREFHMGRGDTMLQYSVCSFDIFVEEVYATLLNGGTLAIPSAEVCRRGLAGVMEFVGRHGVTVISGFPYLLADMNRLPAIPRSLRLLISGGDVLRANYITRLKHMGVKIYNTYGPSETTVCCSYQRCDNRQPLADGSFPVGHPILGVEMRILDGAGREVAHGMTGEIAIYGAGVGRGYLGNPPENKNFTTDAEGRRCYRSGDLGYRLPDRGFAFLRRNDDQVMILGRRVETGEVENVLNESPDVARGVVRHFTDSKGLAYLVAYFVPKHGRGSLRKIRQWLASKLTDFMVPEYFVAMKAIPVTVRGKVDREALPVVLKDDRIK